MVQIKVKEEEVNIKFGIGELTAIDQELGLSVEEINLGEGLEMLVPKLKTGNMIAIAKIIKACLKSYKHKPKTDEEVEDVLENILDDYGTFKDFGEACIQQLGEKRLTRELVEE